MFAHRVGKPPTHGGGGPRSGGEGGSQIWTQFLTCMHTMPPPARLKACHLPREWEALGMFAFQIKFTHKQKFTARKANAVTLRKKQYKKDFNNKERILIWNF